MSDKTLLSNPTVLKAEAELRQALAAYETKAAHCKALYNVAPLFVNTIMNDDIEKAMADWHCLTDKTEKELDELLQIYNEKIATYKRIIGF